MNTILRISKILRVALHYGLDQMVRSSFSIRTGQKLLGRLLFWRDLSAPRGRRLRRALEELGPIFVKFGQVLSTRGDLLPTDIAVELAQLQDNVPPFAPQLAIAIIEQELGGPLERWFNNFEQTPHASASIAQVHFATLKNGREVAVKVLRPGVQKIIEEDLGLMSIAAGWIEKWFIDGKRLKPKEIVAEFDHYLHDELDLTREAANASALRRNFADSTLLSVPEMFWDYCTPNVIVMERMDGIPISQIDRLRAAGVDLSQLAIDGVQIFFTQVFRDGFFHADMHPGNILVSIKPPYVGQYIGLDFGIVGTLNDSDRNYLAQNFLAFFQRDYKRVAQIHIESGWASPETRVDELEGAIRACCEPIFDRPLKDISFGHVLLRLFQTSRRFNIEVQPQLVLLQKTLLNIEGLGRQLDPNLDLWKTAKPYLERWMNEQVGWRGFITRLKLEAPHYGQLLPQFPRLAYQALTQITQQRPFTDQLLQQLIMQQKRTNRLLEWILYFGGGAVGGFLLTQLWFYAKHLLFWF